MAEMLLPPNMLSEELRRDLAATDAQEFADEAVSLDGEDTLKERLFKAFKGLQGLARA